MSDEKIKVTDELLVTPAQLFKTAFEMDQDIKKGLNALAQMKETADTMGKCFVGKGAALFHKNLYKKNLRAQLLMKELYSFPEKLRMIARGYESAERENKNAVYRN